MRRVIAILFILLLTAQYVQVTLNYSLDSYAITLDEEQKEKEGKEDKKEIKEVIASSSITNHLLYKIAPTGMSFIANQLDSPYLTKPTPPPDYSC